MSLLCCCQTVLLSWLLTVEARHHELQDRSTPYMDSQAPHNKSQTLPAKDAVGKQSPTLSAKHAGNSSAVTSTAALDKESLSTRRNLYGAIICGSCGSLVFGFICALKYAQAKKSAPKAGAANKVNAEDGSKQQSFWGGGAGYEYQHLEEAAQEVQEGLGALRGSAGKPYTSKPGTWHSDT